MAGALYISYLYRREILEHPPLLKDLWPFLTENPDFMFLFQDEKACLTYERDVGSIVYLFALFNRDAGKRYNTYLAKVAHAAQMN